MIDSKIKSIKELTNGLLHYADTFSFVLRQDREVSEEAKMLISDLSIFLKDEKDIQEWPGTKLLFGQVTIYMYHLNQESVFVLSHYSDNLHKWVQPELPEDLVFYKENQPVFVSITHEKEAYFSLDDEAIELLTKQGLSIKH